MVVSMDSPSDNLSLSPTEMKVLRVLWESQGKVLSRETLMRKAGLDLSSARRVDSSMVVLRRVLGPDSLRTVRQRGWMLTEEGCLAAAQFLER
jgi:DNA-binding response OmpR family regulator